MIFHTFRSQLYRPHRRRRRSRLRLYTQNPPIDIISTSGILFCYKFKNLSQNQINVVESLLSLSSVKCTNLRAFLLIKITNETRALKIKKPTYTTGL